MEVICKGCIVPELFRQETSPPLMVKRTDNKIKGAATQVINEGKSTELCCSDIWSLKERKMDYETALKTCSEEVQAAIRTSN